MLPEVAPGHWSLGCSAGLRTWVPPDQLVVSWIHRLTSSVPCSMHIASRPTTRCQTGSPLLEESCSICLQQLEEGDTLRSLEVSTEVSLSRLAPASDRGPQAGKAKMLLLPCLSVPVQCAHYHHQACLDKWLKLEACCPICKTRLPGLWGIQLPQEQS